MDQPSASAGAPEGELAAPAPTFTRTLVLAGPDGMHVAVAEFGEGQAVMRMTGRPAPITDKAIACDIESESGGGRVQYATQWKGRPAAFLQFENRHGESKWVLYTGQGSGPVELTYDEARSRSLDATSLYEQHISQLRDGTLEAVQAFHRSAEQQEHDEALQQARARVEADCGFAPAITIDWASVTDQVLKEKSVSSYCANVLDAMKSICRWESGKQFVRDQVARVQCRWADQHAFKLGSGELDWVVSSDATNLGQRARDAFYDQPMATSATLSDAIALEETDVCVDENAAHVIVVHPGNQGRGKTGISYGTSEALHYSPQGQYVSRGWFFEPRRFSSTHNESFRGMDLRNYSLVKVDRDTSSCQLKCGDRTTEFKLVDAGRKREILAGAKELPSPFDRTPHALLRDQRGVYYYVDRGTTEETRSDFRVYSGQRGRVKPMKMRDIVSDSKGQIFSTARGELRLLVDQDEAFWIVRNKRQLLQRVPVEQNYRLIFEELGMYFGKSLGLPCDDF